MKYYSEDDVMDLIREAEDCERAYEWGQGFIRIHFEDYRPIEIPETHNRLIDAEKLKETLMKSAYPEQREWFFAEACQFIDEAPTIVEAST